MRKVAGTQENIKTDEQDNNEEKSGFLVGVWSTMKKTARRSAKFATDTYHSTQDTIDKKFKLRELEKSIEYEVSEILFGEVKQKFDFEMERHQTNLEAISEKYWSDASEKFRSEMINAVTNSEGIADEKKNELEEIIANYETLKFEKTADMVFKFDEFKRHIFFVVETNSLNLNKLKTKYNTLMYNCLIEMLDSLGKSHEGSYLNWEQSLLNELKNNIIKLNPELRKLQGLIDDQTQEISNLKNKKERLLGYQLEIEHLMGWN